MAVFVPKKPFIEVIVVWEGEFFKHIAADLWDATSWLEQYPTNKPGCKARIWYGLA